ncbi:MAG: hydroxylamine reductase [Candidatus Cloacimonetes bacterium]|nr:hydroxylamine reductase [Candidatus Cloacimonadota bacterium]
MFCFQCQETIGNQGCKYLKGACGKPAETSSLMDVLIYTLRGIAIASENKYDAKNGLFIAKSLFATITNANFDEERIMALIREGLAIRDSLKPFTVEHDTLTWFGSTREDFMEKAKSVGVLATEHEDVRSLRELLIYGLKGISAYAEHAAVLGKENDEIYRFLMEGLASTTKNLTVDQMVGLVMKAGEVAVKTMALLDEANTSSYGNPEITEVNIGVGTNPGILISGHDLKDMEELLKQTAGTGIDVYTHSEMLPANYYPAFKKYDHFVGNYGNAWWKQNEEFESFNGPILMTTNCIIPVKESYKNRIFTTGMAGYPGVKHIADRKDGGSKDFSEIIALAKTCPAPTGIETGKIVGGFAHNQVLALADKVVAAVKSGAVKRFVVMAGCDGRHTTRSYFTDVAEALPKDTIILTAGCAKYRYNKLNLGDIGGIPRVLDAGQCNDSYSLAVIALKLKEVFELNDINDLPISFDIAWYEQKAVAVLLALLSLGVKGIRLGPTLPAFLSPNVAKVLVDNFDIKPVGAVKDDIAAMMEGR